MDGIYEVVVGGVNGRGQYAENVFHYQVSGSSSLDAYHTAKALLDAFATFWTNQVSTIVSTEITFNVLNGKLITGSGGPTRFNPYGQQGQAIGDMDTLAAAIDIAFYPGGALNRPGHWFFYGWVAANVISDVIQPAFVTSLVTMLTSYLTPLSLAGGATGQPVTYTRKTKTGTPITTADVRPKLTGFNKRTLPLT